MCADSSPREKRPSREALLHGLSERFRRFLTQSPPSVGPLHNSDRALASQPLSHSTRPHVASPVPRSPPCPWSSFTMHRHCRPFPHRCRPCSRALLASSLAPRLLTLELPTSPHPNLRSMHTATGSQPPLPNPNTHSFASLQPSTSRLSPHPHRHLRPARPARSAPCASNAGVHLRGETARTAPSASATLSRSPPCDQARW